jgi:hypothetical protein
LLLTSIVYPRIDNVKTSIQGLDKTCSVTKFGDVVPQSILKKCIPKNSPDLVKWANVFMMQKLMNPKKKNSIELNTPKVGV